MFAGLRRETQSGQRLPEKCATVVLESWRKWAWRDERKGRKKKTNSPDPTPHCRNNTFLPSPTALFSLAGRKKTLLSRCPSRSHGNSDQRLAQTNPSLRRKLELDGGEGVAAAAQSFSGLLWWQRGGGATAAFPTLQELSFSEQRPPSSNPENNPPPQPPSPTSSSDLLAPPFLLPPSHAHTHKHI